MLNCGDDTAALIVMKSLTYVFMYVYVQNAFRNLIHAYPTNKALRIIYHVIRFEFKRALPENVQRIVERVEREHGEEINEEFTDKNKEDRKMKIPLLLRQRTGVQARLRTIRRECRHVPRRQTHRDPERDTGANPMRPHDRQQLACRRKLHTTRFAVQHLRTGEKQDRCRKVCTCRPTCWEKPSIATSRA